MMYFEVDPRKGGNLWKNESVGERGLGIWLRRLTVQKLNFDRITLDSPSGKAPFSLGARALCSAGHQNGRCSDTPVPWTKNVNKQLGKCIYYREIDDKFGVFTSTACEKVNTTGTDENHFR